MIAPHYIYTLTKKGGIGLFKLFWQSLKTDWYKPANLLTEARLILSPLPLVLTLWDPSNASLRWAAMIAFVIIAATDLLDGYIARRFNQITKLGKILDPVVDKLLALLTLIALSIVNPMVWLLTVTILVREISVALLLYHAKRRGRVVAVIYSGKVKTVAQVVAITFLLIPIGGIWNLITLIAVGAAIALTMSSWDEYAREFRK